MAQSYTNLRKKAGLPAPTGLAPSSDVEDKAPAVFEAVRNAQLIEGSADFLKPWLSQPIEAKQFWRKAQAYYDLGK